MLCNFILISEIGNLPARRNRSAYKQYQPDREHCAPDLEPFFNLNGPWMAGISSFYSVQPEAWEFVYIFPNQNKSQEFRVAISL